MLGHQGRTEAKIAEAREDDVLHVGRPAFGQEQSSVGIFRLQPGGREAERVKVRLGRSSVNMIEIVDGLKEGDQVILSDTSAWDAFDRLRLLCTQHAETADERI